MQRWEEREKFNLIEAGLQESNLYTANALSLEQMHIFSIWQHGVKRAQVHAKPRTLGLCLHT